MMPVIRPRAAAFHPKEEIEPRMDADGHGCEETWAQIGADPASESNKTRNPLIISVNLWLISLFSTIFQVCAAR
jgi:hypothetical protein